MYSKARGGIKTGAKEYLQQLKKLDIQIKQRKEQLEELRAIILSASDPSKEHVSGGKSSVDAATIGYIVRAEELETEKNKLVEAYLNLKDEIINRIQALPDPVYMEVLYKRYVEYKSLEQIAVEMHYSYVYTCRIHGKALIVFSKRLNNVNF